VAVQAAALIVSAITKVTMVATTVKVVITITIKTALLSRQETDLQMSGHQETGLRAWVDPRRDRQGGAGKKCI
jgi:hypothetical protein